MKLYNIKVNDNNTSSHINHYNNSETNRREQLFLRERLIGSSSKMRILHTAVDFVNIGSESLHYHSRLYSNISGGVLQTYA